MAYVLDEVEVYWNGKRNCWLKKAGYKNSMYIMIISLCMSVSPEEYALRFIVIIPGWQECEVFFFFYGTFFTFNEPVLIHY